MISKQHTTFLCNIGKNAVINQFFTPSPSQDHRLGEVGSKLWRPFSSTPLLKQGHLQQLAQDHAQVAFEVLKISKETDCTTSLGNLYYCSITCKVQNYFLIFRQNLLCTSLCLLPLVLVLGTNKKSLAGFSLHPPPFRHLYPLVTSPKSPLL